MRMSELSPARQAAAIMRLEGYKQLVATLSDEELVAEKRELTARWCVPGPADQQAVADWLTTIREMRRRGLLDDEGG